MTSEHPRRESLSEMVILNQWLLRRAVGGFRFQIIIIIKPVKCTCDCESAQVGESGRSGLLYLFGKPQMEALGSVRRDELPDQLIRFIVKTALHPCFSSRTSEFPPLFPLTFEYLRFTIIGRIYWQEFVESLFPRQTTFRHSFETCCKVGIATTAGSTHECLCMWKFAFYRRFGRS